MKIKEQTRKLAAGCSKHYFEVVDRTDEVSSKHCFEVADRTDEVSNIYIRQGEADVVWRDFRRVSYEKALLLKMRSKAFWISIILLFQGSFSQQELQEHHQRLGQGWKSILVEGLSHLPRQLVPSYELGLLKGQWCSSPQGSKLSMTNRSPNQRLRHSLCLLMLQSW